MKILEFLQGKWLGHPLHPAIVHVPLGLWTGACAIDLVVWYSPGRDVLPALALYAVCLGLAAAVAAVPTGVADWASIKKEKPAWKIGVFHMLVNLVATLVWSVNLGIRLSAYRTGESMPQAVLVTSLIATALIFIGGYLGSLLVFDRGVSIARQSKSKWRERAKSGGSHLPEEKP